MVDRVLTDALAKAHGDPVFFIRTWFPGHEPNEWQKRALAAIAKHDRVAIKSGHGVGKTRFLAWVAWWWVFTRMPALVPCTANTASQLSDVLWAEMRKLREAMHPGFREMCEITSDSFRVTSLPNNRGVARTAARDRPEALQGFHEENLLFLIDEASGVPEIIFEVGQGALSTPGAKVAMTGNPTRASGYFFDAFNKNRDRWHCITVRCQDSPQVSPQFIADMAMQYGEDSNVFRVRVLGEFPAADEDSVIPRHWVEAAQTRDIEVEELARPVWGLDVARFGDDESILCKRVGGVVSEPLKVWRQIDLMELVGRIKLEYDACSYKTRPDLICIDAIGLGSGVCDRLTELGLPAMAINVAEKPSMSGKYMRLRDELWFKAREWFEGMACRIPPDEELVAELAAPKFSVTSAGKLWVEAKDVTKKRIGRSPNRADALLLSLAGEATMAAYGSSHRWGKPLEYPEKKWGYVV